MARKQHEQKGAAIAKSDTVWRIAVYIRLSREDSNAELDNNSESVVNQKKILDEYIEDYFEGCLYEIYDYYVDDGLTGTDDTRADFMRLIQDIENQKINCMICKTLSRAFRNYADQGYYLEQYFPTKNTRFISTGDPFVDTYKNPDAVTGLEIPISGLMNDRFAAKTSSDIRRTFNMKRRKGEFIGAFPPYGYLKDPQDKNHLVLDEEIVPIKRKIKDWIIQDGMSLNGVAHKLNDLGIPNPTAYKKSKGWKYNNPRSKENDGLWCGSTVRRMLLDKMNLGHMIQGKQRVVSYKVHDKVAVPQEEWYCVENTHEPTFTQEEYDALFMLLQRDTRTKKGESTQHLFAGFVRCADCKKAMWRSVAKTSVYYICRTYAEKSKAHCTRHSIPESGLEKAVLAAIKAQCSILEEMADAIEKIKETGEVKTQSLRISKLLDEKEKELKKVRSVSDSLYTDWKTGDLQRDEYLRIKEKYQEQMQQISSTIENLKEEQERISATLDSDSDLFADFLKFRNIDSLNRNILNELIDTIFVYEGRRITIRFKNSDEVDRVREFVEMNNIKI